MSAQQEAKDAALRDALRSRYVRGVAVEATVGVWEAAFDAAWKARGEADRAALEDLLADEGEIDYEETNRAAGVAAAIAALDEQ